MTLSDSSLPRKPEIRDVDPSVRGIQTRLICLLQAEVRFAKIAISSHQSFVNILLKLGIDMETCIKVQK
jgi:hypothetical protein